MLKLSAWIIFTISLILLIAWLLSSSEIVIIQAFNFRVEINILVLLAVVILSTFVVFFIIRLIYIILNIPFSLQRQLAERAAGKRLLNISEIILALAAHDLKNATRILNTIKKQAIQPYIHALFRYNLVKLKHDKNLVKEALLEMLQYTETEVPAYISLIELSIEENNWQGVFNYCQKLLDLSPTNWCILNLIKSHMHLNTWQELEAFLQNYLVKELLEKDLIQLLESVAKYKIATKFYNIDPLYALEVLNKVDKKSILIIPAQILYVQIKINIGEFQDAMEVATKIWQKQPNYILLNLFLDIMHNYSKEKFYKIICKLTADKNNCRKNLILMTYAALNNEQIELTDQLVTKILDLESTIDAPTYLMLLEYNLKTRKNLSGSLEYLVYLKGEMQKIQFLQQEYYLDFITMDIQKTASYDSFKIASVF